MGIRASLWRMGAISTGAVLAIFSVGFADKASAATYNYTLNQTEVAAFTGSIGTIQVVENAGNLDFTVTLNAAYRFNAGNQNHHAFSFNADTAVDVLNLTTGFQFPGVANEQKPFGTYTHTISWTGATGWGGGSPGPLTFTLDAVNDLENLTIENLSPTVWKGLDIWFAADLVKLVGDKGETGNVGATFTSKGGGNSPVPLPGALVLFGSVIAGAVTAANIRRRRQQA